MERLTRRVENGTAVYNTPSGDPVKWEDNRHRVLQRLAEYEDLEEQCIRDTTWGLHMLIEKWKEFFDDIEELEGYRKKEAEGKLVDMLCAGWLDIVFGDQEKFWGIDTDYIEDPIREITVDSAERITWHHGWETVVINGRNEDGLAWEFLPGDIGKIVFLTREAAERALQEMMGGEDR